MPGDAADGRGKVRGETIEGNGTVMSTPDNHAIARHLFLSPHYDDIALSCGGTAAKLSREGRPADVAIVFGAEPDGAGELTDFATFQHDRWGLAHEEAVAGRRAEEDIAAAMLGTRVTFLPFHDAIYRGDRYLDDDQLFGEPASDEADLPGRIVAALGLDVNPDPAARVYCPLAIAGHVDHRHAFAAGVLLAGRGWDVCFYEDQPYALEPGVTEARLAEIAAHGLTAQSDLLIDVTATWETKLDAIFAYRSQIHVIFRTWLHGGDPRDEIAAAMRAYALRAGDGTLVERLWRLAPAPTRTTAGATHRAGAGGRYG